MSRRPSTRVQASQGRNARAMCAACNVHAQPAPVSLRHLRPLPGPPPARPLHGMHGCCHAAAPPCPRRPGDLARFTRRVKTEPECCHRQMWETPKSPSRQRARPSPSHRSRTDFVDARQRSFPSTTHAQVSLHPRLPTQPRPSLLSGSPAACLRDSVCLSLQRPPRHIEAGGLAGTCPRKAEASGRKPSFEHPVIPS